jgi:nicotinic acid mononucleotide adenylyltransferase
MTVPRRLGVLAERSTRFITGTFEQREAAEAALTLDEIVVVPSLDPPHRPSIPGQHVSPLRACAPRHRRPAELATVRHGTDQAGAVVHGAHAPCLHADGWQPSQIFFILGADAFAEIDTWHDFPPFWSTHNSPSLPAGATLKATGQTPTGVHMIQADTPDISSTDIRRGLRRGVQSTTLYRPRSRDTSRPIDSTSPQR